MDTFCDSGELLLMAAQASEDAEMKVDVLLQHDANLHSTTQSGMGLSHVASLQGSLHILQKASTTSVDMKDNSGNSPLHYVASSHRSYPDVVDCANYLVSLGANVDAVNNCGWTPLDTALKFEKRHVVMALVRAGASLPRHRVAHTLTVDQLSILSEIDVIAASRKPVIFALKTTGLIQKMCSNIDQYCYDKLAENVEETAAIMLTFDVKGVSEVTDEVVFAAVENKQKRVSSRICLIKVHRSNMYCYILESIVYF